MHLNVTLGGIYGLDLNNTDLVTLYESTLEALAYETKFIFEEMKLSKLKTVLMCGGLTKNEAYLQIHADVLNCEVISMRVGETDMMLVGSAILAKQAALKSDLNFENVCNVTFADLQSNVVKPDLSLQVYHETKYKCYKQLMAAAEQVETLMSQVDASENS
ncbi:FGGY carbohydrate kinase domain-containing protein-like isoform X3 [Leptotrombidium deliense]|uniref:FGGY carbohydrate kinase domain-containing protein-like isoform X3 n=1 Tax=Leptotrombidium deliense TaxID=299467 RepID=A0A443SL13_9ACAR|nr:FGGY carbohydrate kinase domain-containing protein-like isoform X3 [Leptotrombidium deliense]